MKFKKQKELIENLVSSPDAFALCNAIIDYEYFDVELQPTMKFILSYFEKYTDLPSISQIEAETDVVLELKEIKEHHLQYTVDEVEMFCKGMALQDAVMESAKIITEGKDSELIRELVENALLVSVKKDLGIDYFATVEERLARMQEEAELLPTCWPIFNEIIFGGLARKELVLFAANSGVGKSVALANLGMHYAEDGLNVLCITLELAEDLIGQRFDTSITRISRRDWRDNIREIIAGVEEHKKECRGNLQVKYMPTETKAVEIRTYLEQYKLHYGFYPDVICLDYLDKMTPNAAVTGNAFDVDKKIAEQLRQIAVDFNLVMITASQLNRDAIGNSQQNHAHIAGGISKINESDLVVSLYKPGSVESDGKQSNALPDALNEVTFKFLKTRNSDGVDKIIDMKFNSNKIQFEEDSERSRELKLIDDMDRRDKDKNDIIKNRTTFDKIESGQLGISNDNDSSESVSSDDLSNFEFG